MAVSFGIQSWIEGGVISAVVMLNIVVGFIQVLIILPIIVQGNISVPAVGRPKASSLLKQITFVLGV